MIVKDNRSRAFLAAAAGAMLLGGCAQDQTTMVVTNDTDATLLVEPAVQDTFKSDWASSVELAPGEAWSGSWSLPRRAWVLVHLRKAGEPAPRDVQDFNVKSVRQGQHKAYRAMTQRSGRLVLIEGE